MSKRILLACGITASMLYVAMNVFLPMLWEGFDVTTRTVSELSAIDAPTRGWWVPFGVLYGVLMTAFAWGVWSTARGNRPLRIAAGLLLAYGALCLVPWPPMHQREVLAAGGGTLTDTLHIAWSMVTVLLMLIAIGFGGWAFDRAFRVYSVVSLAALAVFGGLTTVSAPLVSANLPTPLLGVWERICIGLFLAWNVVLALSVARSQRFEAPRAITTSRPAWSS